MDTRENGDGHVELEIGSDGEPIIKGPTINLSDKQPLFGRITPQHQSLLHRVISAIKDNSDYRQELKTALFTSSDEADEAVSALDECFALGMDPTPIINQIIARSAGQNHDLLYEALRTLTHTSFTTNYPGNKNEKRNRKSNTFP